MHHVVRALAIVVLCVGAIPLVFGALMFQAAITTGADRDYNVVVSWRSALMSALSPAAYFSLAPIVVAAAIIGATAFVVFRVRRSRAIPLLFLEAAVIWVLAGWLGSGLLLSELTTNHFALDGEVLGELWPPHESLAIWCAVVALLALLRCCDTIRTTPTPNPSDGANRYPARVYIAGG